MRIVHVYKDYYPVLGGIENHVRALAQAFSQLGHEVTVLTTSRDRSAGEEWDGAVRVVKTSRWLHLASTPISPRLFLQAGRLGVAADIVHLHYPYPPGEVAVLSRSTRGATVVTYHSDIVGQRLVKRFYEPVALRLLQRADRVIATSPPYRDTSPLLKQLTKNSCVIPLGVDCRRFANPPAERLDAFRRKMLTALKVDQLPLLLLSVGRLRYYKGLETLVEALKAVPEACLVIAGSGPQEGALRSLAQTVGIAARIWFAGTLSDEDLVCAYHACDLFILPSHLRAEAFGTVLLEAMACRLPCITTEIGTGTSWVVQHRQTGLVVPPDDSAALAAAIREIAADPAGARALGLAGQQRVHDSFTQERMVRSILDLYQAVVQERSR
jgi:rhamnosyl/mannosyltransferase